MLLFLLLPLMLENPSFTLGEAPVDIRLNPLFQGLSLTLSERVDNTFCFLVLPDCERCAGTLDLAAALQDKYDVIVVFAATEKQRLAAEIKASGFALQDAYVVNPSEIKALDFKSFPLVLCYRGARLHFAGSARFRIDDYRKFISFYERKPKGQHR